MLYRLCVYSLSSWQMNLPKASVYDSNHFCFPWFIVYFKWVSEYFQARTTNSNAWAVQGRHCKRVERAGKTVQWPGGRASTHPRTDSCGRMPAGNVRPLGHIFQSSREYRNPDFYMKPPPHYFFNVSSLKVQHICKPILTLLLPSNNTLQAKGFVLAWLVHNSVLNWNHILCPAPYHYSHSFTGLKIALGNKPPVAGSRCNFPAVKQFAI